MYDSSWVSHEEDQSKGNEYGLALTAQEPPLLCQGTLLLRSKTEALGQAHPHSAFHPSSH